jgi:enoyl-CoA hydratase/carnithine racemase
MTDIVNHIDQGVMTLTFNRVEKKNSITQDMYTSLADALEQAEKDPAVRVVLFQGHETVFTAGHDIGNFLRPPPDPQNPPFFRFLHNLAAFPKPVLAAVAGTAVGLGTTMLFHCDMVYAGDNAVFSMNFVNMGTCPEGGSSFLGPKMMGYHRAAEAILMGEPINAASALEAGLVNRVMPASEVNAYTLAQARKLADKPMSSLIETKRLMKAPTADQVKAQIAEERASWARMLREPAAREYFRAFMEKRKPDFSKL